MTKKIGIYTGFVVLGFAICYLLFGRQNNGVGIDLGFNYHVNDKLLLEASVLDLGFISWNQYTSNSNLSEWDYTYSGIEDAIICSEPLLTSLRSTLSSLPAPKRMTLWGSPVRASVRSIA